MATKNKYWKGIEELHETPEFLEKRDNEFPAEVSVDEFLSDGKVNEFTTGRRDFLKYLGFSVTAATLASCEAPIIKSVPYVNKPEEITPGIANWYASTYYDGNDYGSVLVKTREGRPIHVVGNKHYGINAGNKYGTGTGSATPRMLASVLPLYNEARLQGPTKDGVLTDWKSADSEIVGRLKKIASGGGKVRLVSNTIISPSTKGAIDELIGSLGGSVQTIGTDNSQSVAEISGGADVKHVQYDSVSCSGIRRANEKNFGKSVIPSYSFDKANVIVSIAADFLGNWLLHSQYTAQYAAGRKPNNGEMSKHYQFESNMSLTGSNADVRIGIKPSQEGIVAAAIFQGVTGTSLGVSLDGDLQVKVDKVVNDLKQNAGKSLVIAGANDQATQILVNGINNALNNYGATIDLGKAVNIKQGNDIEIDQLSKEVEAGKVDAILFYNTNPVYSLANGVEFAAGLKKTKLSVSFAQVADETASKCEFVLPDNHYLESWNDYNPVSGHYDIAQPVIRPLYDTRQAQESFLVWAGAVERSGSKDSKVFYDYMRQGWEKYGFPMQTQYTTFEEFWNWAVHNGSSGDSEPPSGEEVTSFTYLDVSAEAAGQVKRLASEANSKFEVALYEKIGLGDGQHAANPWLQEMPDPITKVCWDNYVTMAVTDVMEFKGVTAYRDITIGEQFPATVAAITINGVTQELPVVPCSGQAKGTVGVALGYGRGEDQENIGRAAFVTGEYGGYTEDDNGNKVPIGKNAFKWASIKNGQVSYSFGKDVVVKATDKTFPIASTQTHHTVMSRTSVVREASLETYRKGNKEEFNPAHTLAVHEGGQVVKKAVGDIDLWAEHPIEDVGHRWGMSIDLNSCIGCSACVISCHSENNVPVVGKDEVRRTRDMHWLRIDRYFSSDMNPDKAEAEGLGAIDKYLGMEQPSDSPSVVHMPMMCHHCNHAPCETVCPVAATTHSQEGFNQMAYNRCIGTRYCANNCPYKVRRFNWFNYQAYSKFTEVNPATSVMERMVLNPDVVVRARGVMEKCSFCVQKVQEGKLKAKKEGRPLTDIDVSSACADACPTNAIQFGDWNDKGSEVRKAADSDRAYQVLEEVGVKPNVWYQTKVRNVEGEMGMGIVADHHGLDHGHGDEEHGAEH